MKISHTALMRIEEERKVLMVQSESFPEIVYAADRNNNVVWVINRRTGKELEIAVENVDAFIDELVEVVDVHLSRPKVCKISRVV